MASMLLPNLPSIMPRRLGPADFLIGMLGAAVIRVVLGLARLWARLTRSPWHG